LTVTLSTKQATSSKIADRLDLVGSRVASAQAARIRLCNQDWNVFEGQGMVAPSGKSFNGQGLLWNCNCRLCSFCVAKVSRRNRKISDFIVDNQPPETYVFGRRVVPYEWRYVVPTMPDDALVGLSLYRQRQIFYHAWRLFSTKSQWFKEVVSGGIKTEEHTYNEFRDDSPNPYHYHGNLLLYCQFLDQKKFKEEWTKALKAAFKKYGVEWQCRTGYKKFILSLYCFLYSKPSMDLYNLVCLRAAMCGLANVYLKRVVNYEVNEDHPTQISVKNAVKYITKYATKPQTWEEIPTDDLREVVENRRFWRMFEVFGSCRKTALPIRPKAVTRCASAPVIVNYRAGELISQLSNGCFYVHTPNINAKSLPFAVANPSNAPPKERKKSWFYRVSTGITSVEKYKNEIINNFILIRSYRIKQLQALYPLAKFRMLDGAKFHGNGCICGSCPLAH
jgi:hypothetical protein